MLKNYVRIIKLGLFIISLGLSYLVLSSETFHDHVFKLTPIALVAELAAGALYTSFATIPVALSMMSVMVEDSNRYVLALAGGLGATIADSIILRVIRKAESTIEIQPRLKNLRRNPLGRVLVVISGVLALAAPVPDELAMGMIGIGKLSWRTFVLIVYPIKAIGIFAVLQALGTVT